MEFFSEIFFCFFLTNLSVLILNMSMFKQGQLPMGSYESFSKLKKDAKGNGKFIFEFFLIF